MPKRFTGPFASSLPLASCHLPRSLFTSRPALLLLHAATRSSDRGEAEEGKATEIGATPRVALLRGTWPRGGWLAKQVESKSDGWKPVTVSHPIHRCHRCPLLVLRLLSVTGKGIDLIQLRKHQRGAPQSERLRSDGRTSDDRGRRPSDVHFTWFLCARYGKNAAR